MNLSFWRSNSPPPEYSLSHLCFHAFCRREEASRPEARLAHCQPLHCDENLRFTWRFRVNIKLCIHAISFMRLPVLCRRRWRSSGCCLGGPGATRFPHNTQLARRPLGLAAGWVVSAYSGQAPPIAYPDRAWHACRAGAKRRTAGAAAFATPASTCQQPRQTGDTLPASALTHRSAGSGAVIEH